VVRSTAIARVLRLASILSVRWAWGRRVVVFRLLWRVGRESGGLLRVVRCDGRIIDGCCQLLGSVCTLWTATLRRGLVVGLRGGSGRLRVRRVVLSWGGSVDRSRLLLVRVGRLVFSRRVVLSGRGLLRLPTVV
jgi:hypothetical protein